MASSPPEIHVATVEELVCTIHDLAYIGVPPNSYPRAPLCRGHGSSEWQLESTLERRGFMNCCVVDYLESVRAAHQRCRSLLAEDGDRIGSAEQLQLDLATRLIQPLYGLPELQLFVTLRHAGVPSPLLDWTYDPLIALCFAVGEDGDRDEPFALWHCVPNGALMRTEGAPTLGVTGYNVQEKSARHAVQRAEFTFTVRDSNPRGDLDDAREPEFVALAGANADGFQLTKVVCDTPRSAVRKLLMARGILLSRLLSPAGRPGASPDDLTATQEFSLAFVAQLST